jgi:phosphinothricin acetyltransferase
MDVVRVRVAEPSDGAAVAAVYNEGIAGRDATFETEPRTEGEIEEWIAAARPLLVAEVNGRITGGAWISTYSDRPCYAGVGECSVYVASQARGRGLGTALCEELAAEAERRGFYKLLTKLFTSNVASLRLVRRCGFREVGVHRRHGRLDGEWRDVVLVERLLGEAAIPADQLSEPYRSHI